MTSPSVPTSPEIQLLDLEKHFREVRAVDGVSLEIGAGEFFSLLGPSGCGRPRSCWPTTTSSRRSA